MVENEFVTKLNESRCDGGQDPALCEISLQSAEQKPLDPRRSVTLKIDDHKFVLTQQHQGSCC